MRAVWIVRIHTEAMPEGFRLCECVNPEIVGSVVTSLCRAFASADERPQISVLTEVRSAPLTVTE